MQRLLTIMLVLATAALALAGCGDGGSGSSSGADPAASGSPQTTADGAVQVTMRGTAFDPVRIAVRAGQRITWVNEDDSLHDVVSTDGEKIESELFPNGQTFSFTPTSAGTIRYVCTIHPGMEGSIEVS